MNLSEVAFDFYNNMISRGKYNLELFFSKIDRLWDLILNINQSQGISFKIFSPNVYL